MYHNLDPCKGCTQSHENCQTLCEKFILFQIIKETKDTFYSKIDEALINFPEYWNEISPTKFSFKEEVLIREFTKYLKQNIWSEL